MGTNCAPLLADLFLYSYENEFLDNMIKSGHRRLARSFNLCYRYKDDLIVFNNKKFLDHLKEVYPSQLTVEKTNKSDHLADYLDLTFIIDSRGKLSTRLYDKRDDFDFHIVNFPFLSSNIPSGPSYGVYISQLIHNNPTYVINHSFQSSIGPIVEIFLPAMREIKIMVRKFVKPRVSIDSGMSSCSNVCHLSC